MGTGLASEEFWEDDYLGSVKLPARPDPSFQFDRILMAALADHAPVASGDTVVEVGCAPAAWLGFYAERFAARVTGIEYTARGAELSRENLAALGVPGEILHRDFFEVAPAPYDLVLSLGFIEHFDDIAGTFARHAEFVAPGGLMALGLPHYRGLMGVLQRIGDPKHLAIHNTRSMDNGLWRRLAAEHGLVVSWQAHIDGPDPAMLSVRRRWLMPVVLVLQLVAKTGLGRRLNSRWTSAYSLTVLRRPR